MNFILDTCVISELIKEKPNENVTAWVEKQNEINLYLSVITIGEIVKGIGKIKSLNKKKKIENWMDQSLIPRFEGRLLNINIDIIIAWGNMTAMQENKGKPLSAIDSLIAATAIYHKMAVITRNLSDFQVQDLIIINPWEEI